MWDLSLEVNWDHRVNIKGLFRSFLQQRKACFPVLQISALNQVSPGGFCLLFHGLQSGCGLLLLVFFIASLLGWDGFVELYCCLILCWRPFSMSMCPFMLELPSCHSLLMSLVLFQEHITNCHHCLTDWKCKTETNVWWLCVGGVKTPVAATLIYLLWRVCEDIIKQQRKKGKWDRIIPEHYHRYSRQSNKNITHFLIQLFGKTLNGWKCELKGIWV